MRQLPQVVVIRYDVGMHHDVQHMCVQVADADLQTLLLWKNVRMPFKEQSPVTLVT